MSEDSGWEAVARAGARYSWAALVGAAAVLLAGACALFFRGTAVVQDMLLRTVSDIFFFVSRWRMRKLSIPRMSQHEGARQHSISILNDFSCLATMDSYVHPST